MERQLKVEKTLRKFTKLNLVTHVRKLQLLFIPENDTLSSKTVQNKTKTGVKRRRFGRERDGSEEETIESDEADDKMTEDERTTESDENAKENDLTKANFIEILLNRLRKDVSTEYATSHLDLLNTFVCRSNRIWRLFHLFDEKGSSGSNMRFEPGYFERKLRKKLEATFNCTVTVQIHGGFYWIRLSLLEKNRRKTNEEEKIVYAVHELHFPYIGVTFILKKHSFVVLSVLANVFGYKKADRTALVDRGVEGLFRLAQDSGNEGFRLRTKLENPLSFTARTKEVPEEQTDKRIRDLDVKEKDERADYNKFHFGTDSPPPIQKLTYMLETPFGGEEFVRSMSERRDRPFRCKVVFEGKDVCKGIQELVRTGIAKIPLPKHLADVRTLGKTEFLIRKKQRTEANTENTKTKSKEFR